MGMFFGGLDEEELNQPPADNFVYNQLKKARYKGIELCESDIITPSLHDGNFYVIKDFKENGQPIVDKVTNQRHEDWNFLYEFDTLFVVKPNSPEYD